MLGPKPKTHTNTPLMDKCPCSFVYPQKRKKSNCVCSQLDFFIQIWFTARCLFLYYIHTHNIVLYIIFIFFIFCYISCVHQPLSTDTHAMTAVDKIWRGEGGRLGGKGWTIIKAHICYTCVYRVHVNWSIILQLERNMNAIIYIIIHSRT